MMKRLGWIFCIVGTLNAALGGELQPAWTYQAPHPPSPAYRDTVISREAKEMPTSATRARMKQFSRQGMAEPATYDYAFAPVVAGHRLFFGSSTDEAVFCLDTTTACTNWVTYTEGAVRFAPIVDGNRLIVASDDGCLYALDVATGAVVWRRPVAPTTGYCIGNGRPISAWPIRGGPVLHNGLIYCAVGVFPEQKVYLAAVKAEDGSLAWRKEVPYALSGQMLVDGDLLWATTHRTAPAQFKLADGSPVIAKPPALYGRGASQIWAADGRPMWGPDEGGMLFLQLSREKPTIKTQRETGLLGTLTMLDGWTARTSDRQFFLIQDDRILAVPLAGFRAALPGEHNGVVPAFSKLMGALADEDDALRQRLEKAAAWSKALPVGDAYRTALVAGDLLILGGNKKVTAFNAGTGAEIWTGAVEGQAGALAVADGAVYASTDTGKLYCFRANAGPVVTHQPVVRDPWPEKKELGKVVAEADRRRGVCVVLGGGDGQLAAAIARQSEFFVIVLEPDAAKIARQRANLSQAGLYGSRVVVRHETGQTLGAYPFGFANLVVADGPVPYESAAVERLVQPYGGTAVLAGKVTHRGALPGAGQWLSANGPLANTMNSTETHVPADTGALRLQWFGAPYAGDTADRHSVPLTPLFQNGIVFLAGKTNTLTGIDAYNGTILWKTTMPKRLLASHNPSPMTCAADGRHVFTLNGAECVQLDAITGQKVATLGEVTAGCDWGYVGNAGNFLIGTSQDKAVAEYASGKTRGQVTANNTLWTSQPSVSRDLFVYDLGSRRKLWTHTGGRIINSTITVAEGRVYFTESRSPAALSDKTGLVKMFDLISRAEIVALDLATGQVLWRQPVTRELNQPMQWLMYLTATDGKLLATRTYFVGDTRGYDFEAFDAATGRSLWTQWWPAEYTGMAFGLAYGKNSLSTRPIIVGDKFYIRVNFHRDTKGDVTGFDLHTGKPVGKSAPAGSNDAGCSVAIGSANALYYRDYMHVAFDLRTSETHRLTGVTRPACWPDTLPVGGLIVAPEGSAYCSCGLSYAMSFALAPVTMR